MDDSVPFGGRAYFGFVGLLAFARGMAPMIAVEFARRAVPPELRPTFKDMEAACKGGAAASAAKAA